MPFIVSRRTLLLLGLPWPPPLRPLDLPRPNRSCATGISLADIPLTTGQPDRGAGAYQFTAHTIYDSLVAWEMNISERPGKLIPGLATAWKGRRQPIRRNGCLPCGRA